MSNPRPTLTLTLRRTGGTSLQNFLIQTSPFEWVVDEPFNKNRIWGHLVKKFREDKDLEALEASIDLLLEEQVNIKHCVEVVPFAVTKVLIKCAMKHGYFFIVLSRRNSIRRLRSLFMAISTDAWEPEHEAEKYPEILSGEVEPAPINLDALVRQYRGDQLRLGQTIFQLRYQKADYDWLVFEELYQGEEPFSVHAAKLAARIGIDVSAEGRDLDKLNESGKQSSCQIEKFVPNYDAMMEILKEICID
ncbi:hypothetical protein [Pseudophaeobacter sp.]|uniref:hypothetical protein n=1 Tax=Pseudophaeobacter sp. TaxID=1971739 RepID=UPI003296D712